MACPYVWSFLCLAASVRLALRQLLFLGTPIMPTTAASPSLTVLVGAALRPATGGGLLHLPCKHVQVFCFMQGFLPHPDSQELVQLLLLPNFMTPLVQQWWDQLLMLR